MIVDIVVEYDINNILNIVMKEQDVAKDNILEYINLTILYKCTNRQIITSRS